MSGSENWQPGDLALAVRYDPEGECGIYADGAEPIRKGGIYTVEAVSYWGIHTALTVAGHYSTHPSRGWNALSFRKVTPEDADQFDREVIELMNDPGAVEREHARAHLAAMPADRRAMLDAEWETPCE